MTERSIIDLYSNPKVNIFATGIHILAQNLSNARHQKVELPSTVEATCNGIYGGHAWLNMKLDPLNNAPTFEAKAELTDMDISRLNDYLNAYGKFSVKQGKISIYTEAAAKDGKIVGYTKPIILDLRVVDWDKDKAQPLKLAWEALIGAVNWVVKNKGKDQTATRVEFSGDLKDPNVNVWYIIGQTLRNGFIQALYPALERSVDIHSVDRINESQLKSDFEEQKKDDRHDKKARKKKKQ